MGGYLVYETALHESCHAIVSHHLGIQVLKIWIGPGKYIHKTADPFYGDNLGFIVNKDQYTLNIAGLKWKNRKLREKYATISAAGIWFHTTHSNLDNTEVAIATKDDRLNIEKCGVQNESIFVDRAADILKPRIQNVEALASILMKRRTLYHFDLDDIWHSLPEHSKKRRTSSNIAPLPLTPRLRSLRDQL